VNQTLQYDIEEVMPLAIETGLFSAFCTIQQPSGNLTADGTPDGLYVAVAGLSAIPCISAVTYPTRILAKEDRTPEYIESSNTQHILLSGFYPQIQGNTQWQAVVTDAAGDITTYDISGSEDDSQAQMTRIKCQVVTV
jgi:hypothetical protein